MKKVNVFFIAVGIVISFSSLAQLPDKYISSKTHIKFFSTTPVQDIEANNYASVSTLNPFTGEVVFSVPMQSFEFEKAKMQQDFNNKYFLETNVYPKSKFKGRITNLDKINFMKDGVYQTEIEGELSIKDVTKAIKESGTIEVSKNTLTINSVFKITLGDYGIAFGESEMVSKKIAKDIEISLKAEYTPQ